MKTSFIFLASSVLAATLAAQTRYLPAEVEARYYAQLNERAMVGDPNKTAYGKTGAVHVGRLGTMF